MVIFKIKCSLNYLQKRLSQHTADSNGELDRKLLSSDVTKIWFVVDGSLKSTSPLSLSIWKETNTHIVKNNLYLYLLLLPQTQYQQEAKLYLSCKNSTIIKQPLLRSIHICVSLLRRIWTKTLGTSEQSALRYVSWPIPVVRIAHAESNLVMKEISMKKKPCPKMYVTTFWCLFHFKGSGFITNQINFWWKLLPVKLLTPLQLPPI